MKKLETKADWNVTKGKRKQKWAKLKDDDLQFAEEQDELWWAELRTTPARPVKAIKQVTQRPPAANRTGIHAGPDSRRESPITIEPSL